jgi:hypothetical protein
MGIVALKFQGHIGSIPEDRLPNFIKLGIVVAALKKPA